VTVALALAILRSNSSPIKMIAQEAGVLVYKHINRALLSNEPKPRPNPAATPGRPIGHPVPPEPSPILQADIE